LARRQSARLISQLFLDPGLKLFGGTAQHIAADPIELPVAGEEADHPLGLLEGLDQPVDQDPVKTAIFEADATLVALIKGVPGGAQKGVHPASPDPEPAP
jgi:hypothetical protein